MPDERTQFTALLFSDIRNAAVLKHPLPADEVVEVIQTYRAYPRWRRIGFPTESRPLHDALWRKARTKDFAFRKIYDTRSALTMTAQGVTKFATVNVKDFEGLGFREGNLGESWRETHELRLHTLGNLTLTGYNAELSNGDFSAKRAVFLQSPVHLSRSIARFEKWDGEAMQQRGEELAELALKTWPNFGPADSLFGGTTSATFTGRTPVAVLVFGERRDAGTWREVLQSTLEAVRDAAPDAFDAIVAEFPRLLSMDAGKFRAPRSLDGTWHFETNLSAEAIARYCQQIIAAAGYAPNEWSVETK